MKFIRVIIDLKKLWNKKDTSTGGEYEYIKVLLSKICTNVTRVIVDLKELWNKKNIGDGGKYKHIKVFVNLPAAFIGGYGYNYGYDYGMNL